MRLSNKVAIVTGGGRDIGRDVSRVLAREGAKVVINYANDEASAAATRGMGLLPSMWRDSAAKCA